MNFFLPSYAANAKLEVQGYLEEAFKETLEWVLTLGVRFTFENSLETFKYHTHLRITLSFRSPLLSEL